jgi:hypothetical protein
VVAAIQYSVEEAVVVALFMDEESQQEFDNVCYLPQTVDV